MKQKCRSNPISLSEKQRLVCLWMEGMSLSAIAREIGVSQKTVSKWIHRWKENGNLDRKQSSSIQRMSLQPQATTTNHTPLLSYEEYINYASWNFHKMNNLVTNEPCSLNYCSIHHPNYLTRLFFFPTIFPIVRG